MATPPDEATLLHLQGLAAELAHALELERRRRRRLEAALRAGHTPARLVSRLDKSARRVGSLIGEIQPLLEAVRNVNGQTGQPAAASIATSGQRAIVLRASNPSSGALVAAAVDIGSNSVHLLVAVVAGHRLEPLLDASEFLGLGDAVDSSGVVGETIGQTLVATLVSYVGRARTLGAQRIVLVGTHPIRRASDAVPLIESIRQATGEGVTILTHEEEAFLTLLGVTAGRPVRRNMLLVDVGGGSSEVLWVPTSGDPVAVGLPLGSARLSRQVVSHDPPTAAEIADLQREARRVMEAAPAAAPDEIVIVGGSATNLLRVIPAAAIDRRITVARVVEALDVLAGETAADAAARHGMREPRARTMPAGAAIVGAILERYGVDRARVDEAGIREGLLLAVTHAATSWQDDLVWLAHGWSR